MSSTDPTPGRPGIADGEATSVANLNLAARQFIEVYGLNPKSVMVETCRAQRCRRMTLRARPLDTSMESHSLQRRMVTPIRWLTRMTVKRYKQLCTTDELKLVRVTAQIDAPTIFLRLLGYPTVTLTESAISQTAVIDVVMIFDVSESMLNETTYSDWDTLSPTAGRALHAALRSVILTLVETYVTPAVLPRNDPWQQIINNTEADVGRVEFCVPIQYSDYDFQDKTIAFEPYRAEAIRSYRIRMLRTIPTGANQ